MNYANVVNEKGRHFNAQNLTLTPYGRVWFDEFLCLSFIKRSITYEWTSQFQQKNHVLFRLLRVTYEWGSTIYQTPLAGTWPGSSPFTWRTSTAWILVMHGHDKPFAMNLMVPIWCFSQIIDFLGKARKNAPSKIGISILSSNGLLLRFVCVIQYFSPRPHLVQCMHFHNKKFMPT